LILFLLFIFKLPDQISASSTTSGRGLNSKDLKRLETNQEDNVK